MYRVLCCLVGFLTIFAGLPGAAAATPEDQPDDCQFILGFATLHGLIPTIVGDCLTDEQHGANGDGLQQTANGLLVWRKADNFTAFTDGFRTWVNGPMGVQERLNTQRFDFEKNATVPATTVITFHPPSTATQQLAGTCFASSLAATRADAFRCMAGNLIMDPCFTIASNASAVLCVRDPRDPSTFVQLNLTQPLPAPEPVPAQTHPWFLELADTTACNFLTGATGAVNGQRINYGCSDGLDVVGLPMTDTVWTVQEVRLAPNSTTVQKTFTVDVNTAWQ
jgi:hypothetical protein